YEELKDKHLTVNKDITEENRTGQRRDMMPWFWLIKDGRKENSSKWLQEFHRIMWLRAKQRQDRWSEEVQQCATDMFMTKNWFKHQENIWKDRAKAAETAQRPGHECYAYKQTEMWHKFYERCKTFDSYIQLYHVQTR
ncbi:hypothetical protein BC835DRAFT_1295238, partial [Cytidiella melzeri]